MSDQNIPVTADANVQIDCDNNNNSSTQNILFTHDNGSELMRIQENGNVGIGTASPGERVSIQDTNTSIQIGDGKGNAGNWEPQIKSLYAILFGLDSEVSGNEFIRLAREERRNWIQSFEATAGNPQNAALTLAAGLTRGIEIDINGNVGIGMPDPTHKLELKTTETEDGIYAYYGANNYKAYSLACAEGMGNFASNLEMFPPTSGFANPLVKLQAHNTGGGTMSLKNSGGTTTVDIRSDGNSYFNGGKVGIGTASPQSKLHIAGNITAAGAGAGITSGIKTTMTLNTSQGCDGLFAVSINPVFNDDYNIDNVGCLNIQPSGAMVNYGIRVALPSGGVSTCGIKVELGAIDANGVYSYIDGGTGRAIWGNAYSSQGAIGGYFEAQSGSIALKTSGISILNGHLMVGTGSNPTEALDVNGNIKVGSSDAFYFGASTGTVGSWRIMRSGNNLVFQRCTSTGPDVWTTKYTISA